MSKTNPIDELGASETQKNALIKAVDEWFKAKMECDKARERTLRLLCRLYDYGENAWRELFFEDWPNLEEQSDSAKELLDKVLLFAKKQNLTFEKARIEQELKDIENSEL